MRLPHNAIRDWWHQPVTNRLDRIEAAVTPPPPGPYSARGQLEVDAQTQESLDRLAPRAMEPRVEPKPWP